MGDYKITVGLEIHAELKTKSKMFCPCKNDPYHGKPNEYVCPICMGHPGTLPVINKEAVRSVLRVGAAVGGELADFTEFDRKNYFYPDIPKGYQISQYKYPLVKGGELSGVKLTRVHLEEDTGTSIHKDEHSILDYNRAGVPLMELVTEPVIHDAKQAGDFAKELQLLLRYLGVSDANMEKGEMRVEANISVSKTSEFGTKVEVKNLNSFKSVEKAIEFEAKRHIEAIESGEKIVQETRGWDENSNKTFSQRKKEESHDYRYFPDPDLPKLKISEIPEFSLKELKASLPELPWNRRKRYVKDFGLKEADSVSFVTTPVLAEFFEKSVNELKDMESSDKDVILISNYILSDIIGILKKKHGEGYEDYISEIKISPKALATVIKMIGEGKISSRGAKDIIAILFEEGGDPEKIAQDKNLIQKNDPEILNKIILEVIEKNPAVVSEFKGGKEVSLQFLVGQGMKISKGSANPSVLAEMIRKKILEN